MENPRIIFLSSTDVQENAVCELIQSQREGPLVRVDAQRRTAASAECGDIRVHPGQLEQFYPRLLTSYNACTVAVSVNSAYATLKFLEEHPGSISDFESVILSTTPDPKAQQSVIEKLNSLSRMGADQHQLRVAFGRAPRAAPVEETYGKLVPHLSEHFPCINLDAVLYESSIYARIRDLRLPLGLMLRGEVDYQVALRQARLNSEPEDVLQQFVQKLMLQRALAGCQAEIILALKALRAPDPLQHNPQAAAQMEETEPPQQAHTLVDKTMTN
jgi:hypothetical protein